MRIGKDVKEKAINILTKETQVFRFVHTLSYIKHVEVLEHGYTCVPNEVQIFSCFEKTMENVFNAIEQNDLEKHQDVFNINLWLHCLLFVRENFINILFKHLSKMLGVGAYGNEVSEKITEELKEIQIFEERSFLTNVYKNLIVKKNVMNFLISTMFMSYFIDNKNIYDVNFETITNSLEDLILSCYLTDKFKITNDEIYLTMNINLQYDIKEEINQESIRNYINALIMSLRDANSRYINNANYSLLQIGRSQIGK